jgi:acyl carrier protein phosphodiesterase
MNYLAHFYLSHHNEKLILGNLLADSMNGSLTSEKYSVFDSEIILGIKLHRNIDFFTDNHPVVRESIKRLRPKYSKYSGVIVDMYYDHFLARNWNKYSNEPLELYSARVYAIFEEYKSIIPPKMDKMIYSMIHRDWLSNYRFKENMQWAFAGIAKRAKFDSKMENAYFDLEEDYGLFQTEFFEFFPDLIANSKKFLLENPLE